MRVRSAGLVLIGLVTLGGCQSGPGPLTDADRATARRMDSTFAAAVGASDVEGMTAAYAPNAIVMPPDMPLAHGREQIRGLWTKMTGQMKATLTLTQETANGGGNFMYTTGRYQLTPMPEGSAPAQEGKYLEVFRRGVDGKWTRVADAWNANAPAEPATEPAPRRRR